MATLIIMNTSLRAPEWRPMPRQRQSVPLTGLLAVVALMLVVSIGSITQQFAGASETVAVPRADIVVRCDRAGGDALLRVHVLLYDDGSAPSRFTLRSQVGDGPIVARRHTVAAGDVTILEFVLPNGTQGAFRVTNDDDPTIDRRLLPTADCDAGAV
jgi:hypothetical protein